MFFLGLVCIIIFYLIYKDNRDDIHEHFKKKANKKENIKMWENDSKESYYARSKYEKDLDSNIRKIIIEDGDKTRMALYLQQQEILNILRKMRDGVDSDSKKDHEFSNDSTILVYGYKCQDGYFGHVGNGVLKIFDSKQAYRKFIDEVISQK